MTACTPRDNMPLRPGSETDNFFTKKNKSDKPKPAPENAMTPTQPASPSAESKILKNSFFLLEQEAMALSWIQWASKGFELKEINSCWIQKSKKEHDILRMILDLKGCEVQQNELRVNTQGRLNIEYKQNTDGKVTYLKVYSNKEHPNLNLMTTIIGPSNVLTVTYDLLFEAVRNSDDQFEVETFAIQTQLGNKSLKNEILSQQSLEFLSWGTWNSDKKELANSTLNTENEILDLNSDTKNINEFKLHYKKINSGEVAQDFSIVSDQSKLSLFSKDAQSSVAELVISNQDSKNVSSFLPFQSLKFLFFDDLKKNGGPK